MPASDRSDLEDEGTGTDHENMISADHFYQLVLMHGRTRNAWIRTFNVSDPDAAKQDQLSRERKKLLQQKTIKKKSDK